jgi:hypothetical protein
VSRLELLRLLAGEQPRVARAIRAFEGRECFPAQVGIRSSALAQPEIQAAWTQNPADAQYPVLLFLVLFLRAGGCFPYCSTISIPHFWPVFNKTLVLPIPAIDIFALFCYYPLLTISSCRPNLKGGSASHV